MTNLPHSTSTQEAVDLTYQRCDQENIIEQLQHGIAGMRIPPGGLLANAAFLTCARLARNLKAWRAQLALPSETMRWGFANLEAGGAIGGAVTPGGRIA
jgi:hypothetical protein